MTHGNEVALSPWQRMMTRVGVKDTEHFPDVHYVWTPVWVARTDADGVVADILMLSRMQTYVKGSSSFSRLRWEFPRSVNRSSLLHLLRRSDMMCLKNHIHIVSKMRVFTQLRIGGKLDIPPTTSVT